MAIMKGAIITLAAFTVTAAVLMAMQGPPMEGARMGGVGGPTSAQSTPAAVDEVRMMDLKYSPATIVVPVGTTVTWTNDDPLGHTVTPVDAAAWGSAGSGNDPDAWLQQGATYQHTFTKAGTYVYYCLPHASRGSDGNFRGMVGTVIVGEGVAPVEAPFAMPSATVVPDPTAPARLAAAADGRVHVTLTTKEVVAQLTDGAAYTFWTFDGTVPGPMLRVGVNDTVELTLRNDIDSTQPHSIDLHAVTGPGGGATLTQTKPGESTTFTFKAINPGLYVYHCASPHIPSHVANGMYGLILVEPDGGLPPVDREYFVVQGEVYTSGDLGAKGLQSFSLAEMLDERPDYYLLNGRVGALTGAGALTANVGETVRIYFGVGGFVPSSFHVIGEIFDAVYPEGATTPVPNVQTTLVPAGGATIVDFKVEVPGNYILVDHWLTHAIDRGAVGILTVSGEADPAIYGGAGR